MAQALYTVAQVRAIEQSASSALAPGALMTRAGRAAADYALELLGDARTAPVLVLAGENDPRCPIRQIDNYLAALDQRGKAHEVYRFDAGHGSLVIEETIRQVEVALAFALQNVTP